jgi:hypothetical protein
MPPLRKKQAPSSDSERLVALAALGRRKRDQAERQKEKKRRADRESALFSHEREVRATLRQASLEYVLLVTLGILIPFGVIWWAAVNLDVKPACIVAAFALSITAGLVFIRLRALGRRVVERERAFLAALPFTVDGYFDVIGVSPSSLCTLTVQLHFRDGAIDESTARDIGGVIDAELDAVTRQVVCFKSPSLDCTVNDGDDTNAPVLAYMRRALRELALPVHADNPLRAIRFHRQ